MKKAIGSSGCSKTIRKPARESQRKNKHSNVIIGHPYGTALEKEKGE